MDAVPGSDFAVASDFVAAAGTCPEHRRGTRANCFVSVFVAQTLLSLRRPAAWATPKRQEFSPSRDDVVTCKLRTANYDRQAVNFRGNG
jgi:hypothetical protein